MALPRRPRRSPFGFGDFFADFDRLESMFEEMFKEMSSPEFQRKLSKEPLVYGVNIRIGPEGKARVEPFGNVNVQQRKISEEREPLVDVIEEKDVVRAIVELPGATKESIRLQTKDTSLEVRAQSGDQKFRKLIDLPAEVLSEGSKATFKNGILEVVLRKRTPGKPRTAPIRVE
jgi:HSP20 family protein